MRCGLDCCVSGAGLLDWYLVVLVLAVLVLAVLVLVVLVSAPGPRVSGSSLSTVCSSKHKLVSPFAVLAISIVHPDSNRLRQLLLNQYR